MWRWVCAGARRAGPLDREPLRRGGGRFMWNGTCWRPVRSAPPMDRDLGATGPKGPRGGRRTQPPSPGGFGAFRWSGDVAVGLRIPLAAGFRNREPPDPAPLPWGLGPLRRNGHVMAAARARTPARASRGLRPGALGVALRLDRRRAAGLRWRGRPRLRAAGAFHVERRRAGGPRTLHAPEPE